jgi:hypothetical protein
MLGIVNQQLTFVNEKDKSVIQQWPLTDITKWSRDKKRLLVEFGATQYEFQFQHKKEAVALLTLLEHDKVPITARTPESSVASTPRMKSDHVVTSATTISATSSKSSFFGSLRGNSKKKERPSISGT